MECKEIMNIFVGDLINNNNENNIFEFNIINIPINKYN